MLEGLEIAEVHRTQLEYSGRLDTEYYRPEYLKYETLLKGRGSKPLSHVANFLIGPFGSAFTVENYTQDKTYRYIRGKDIKPMRLMDDDSVYMPQKDFERLSRYSLRPNDLLVSVVGTLGNAAIIEAEDTPAIFSCKSAVVRVNSINPYYLLTYLNSKFGHSLLLRKQRGAVQQGLNLDDLKTLDVFVASTELQIAIEKIYKKSTKITSDSTLAFAQAETLLLQTLGMTNFAPSSEAVNIKSFKDSFASSGRMDAEYYQPKYEMLLKLLKRDGLTIGDMAAVRNERFRPNLEGNFEYIEIGGLNGDGTVTAETTLHIAAPSRASQLVRSGDIVTSTVRPIRRLTGLIAPAQEASVCSSGFVVLNPQHIAAEVLLVFLRIPLICELLDLQTTATMYPAISEKDLLAIPIHKIKQAVQTQIAELVQQSFKLKAESERLLEVAKRAVEVAIEQDEAAGMAYIEAACV